MKSGVTIIGLGPGDPGLLTRQAWETINQTPEIYLRTIHHPAVEGFPPNVKIHSFDPVYQEGDTFEAVYDRIVEQVIVLAERPEGIVYAVPGHPSIAEATTPEIARRARAAGLPVRILEGLSFIEPTFKLLDVDPFPYTSLVDAITLESVHHPPFPPDAPALIAQIYSRAVATEVKLTLMAVYPDHHEVVLVHGAGTSQAKVERLPLYQIDQSEHTGLLTCLYIPSLGEATSFESFQEIVAHLRAPEGCPWDREQTHLSLRPFLLEEAYEVLTAIDSEDPESILEELGDLLLQVVLHAQIASESGEFAMADILREIHKKLVRRHPHVFGDLKIEDAEHVIENWEKLKLAEKEQSGEKPGSVLDGVSLDLPALFQSEAYQRRAASVGFQWETVESVWEKLSEELKEIQQAISEPEREIEIGDLLFAVVSLSHWMGIDAESALRQANARFRIRFMEMEEIVRKEGRQLSEISKEELVKLWGLAKKMS